MLGTPVRPDYPGLLQRSARREYSSTLHSLDPALGRTYLTPFTAAAHCSLLQHSSRHIFLFYSFFCVHFDLQSISKYPNTGGSFEVWTSQDNHSRTQVRPPPSTKPLGRYLSLALSETLIHRFCPHAQAHAHAHARCPASGRPQEPALVLILYNPPLMPA